MSGGTALQVEILREQVRVSRLLREVAEGEARVLRAALADSEARFDQARLENAALKDGNAALRTEIAALKARAAVAAMSGGPAAHRENQLRWALDENAILKEMVAAAYPESQEPAEAEGNEAPDYEALAAEAERGYDIEHLRGKPLLASWGSGAAATGDEDGHQDSVDGDDEAGGEAVQEHAGQATTRIEGACDDCGSAVTNWGQHYEWHANLNELAEMSGRVL